MSTTGSDPGPPNTNPNYTITAPSCLQPSVKVILGTPLIRTKLFKIRPLTEGVAHPRPPVPEKPRRNSDVIAKVRSHSQLLLVQAA